jgi:GNAT superfamily N-acetyltransferase
MMTLQLRPMPLAGVQARFGAEEVAREQRSSALLASLGVTAPPREVHLLTGRVILWECVAGPQVVGHCAGDCLTGEILSLEVVASHEGRGIGRKLLLHVADCLRAAGARRVWVVGPADPRVRAHGFYRAVGCRSTAARAASGDEILEVPTDIPSPDPECTEGHDRSTSATR